MSSSSWILVISNSAKVVIIHDQWSLYIQLSCENEKWLITVQVRLKRFNSRMTEEILLTRTTLTQLFKLSGYPTVTVLPPPDAGSFSSLSSVRICNKQRRRRYSRLIQTILWTKVTLGKAFWKALNKKANRDLKGQFGKLERPTRSLKLFCLWFLDNVKVPLYKSLELVSFKKRSLNKKNNDVVLEVYSPVHLRVQSTAQTFLRSLCHFEQLHTYDTWWTVWHCVNQAQTKNADIPPAHNTALDECCSS